MLVRTIYNNTKDSHDESIKYANGDFVLHVVKLVKPQDKFLSSAHSPSYVLVSVVV